MKKTLMITLLSATALTLFATSADAVEKIDKTDVGVSFKSNDVNEIGDNKPFKDNLAVVWKPTSFEFGQQKAAAYSQVFSNTVGDSANNPQFVIVNDDRPDAKRTGKWDLKASLTNMKTTKEGSSVTLPSKLTMTLGGLQSYAIGNLLGPDQDYIAPYPTEVDKPDGTKKNITDFAPTGDLADFKLGDGAAGTDQPVELEAGGSAVNILGRDKNQTKGGFATKIKDVKLVVANANDAGAAGHEFAGQVIWSLNDTP